jgi:phage tail-like protein
MPGVIGKSRSFHKKYKFIIEIDDFGSSQWQKCSELSAEIAKIEQWEGGSLIPNKSPGRVTFSDITIERGATSDKDLYTWFKLVADAVKNSGEVDDAYKKNLDVVQQSRNGKSLRRWEVAGAWMTKFSAGDWDNTVDENVMESGTLTYDTFELTTNV